VHVKSVDKIHVGNIYSAEEELIISDCVTLSNSNRNWNEAKQRVTFSC